MALLGYNKRLIWVIIPLVLWSVFGLLLAVGAGARDGTPAPLHVKLDLPEGGLWLRGQLLSIVETEGVLTVQVGVREGEQPPLENPHADLVIEQIEIDRPPLEPPEITIAGTDSVMLPNGRGAALTEHYLIRFGPGDVRIIPRPLEMDSTRFHQMLRQFKHNRDERRPPDDAPPRLRREDSPPGSQQQRPRHPGGRPVRGR